MDYSYGENIQHPHPRMLGIEFGSTRIKSVLIDSSYQTVASGDYTWKSNLVNGIWTYSLEEVWQGLRQSLSKIGQRDQICAAGISGMMHGYLAFDQDWNLLVPFRTWQNTITGEAAEKLTDLFGFNIPQRWSIAHLYQAILNQEPHIQKIAHITTLAGYVHFMLTGENCVGIGEASGILPIDSNTCDYDAKMLATFDAITDSFPCKLRDLLPRVLVAGQPAGRLTNHGQALLENMLTAGIPFAPPEGDAGTGMVATNAVAPRTGNVSAGTSIFSMVVLERPLVKIYPEIDLVTTPAGAPVAMVHCNNCTQDMNAWAGVFQELLSAFGAHVNPGELFSRLYQMSLAGDADCGGVTVINYLAGEGITHFDDGRPLVIRTPQSQFSLANFLRAQLYSTMATLKIGMDLLSAERVRIDVLLGHGGLFKTPVVGQRYLAAACGVPVTCMETAGDGGPYGMALLVSYMMQKGENETLSDYLKNQVFVNTPLHTIEPSPEDMEGFSQYLSCFHNALAVEKAAAEAMPLCDAL